MVTVYQPARANGTRMGSFVEAVGPLAILGSWVVGLTWWAARMATRMDALDKDEHGRVPKLEERVDEIDDKLATIETNSAVAATNTEWIKAMLERALRTKEPTR